MACILSFVLNRVCILGYFSILVLNSVRVSNPAMRLTHPQILVQYPWATTPLCLGSIGVV